MQSVKRFGMLIVGAALLASVAAACTADKPTTATNEGRIRDNSYNGLAARQPAHTMSYSPTRDQINFWIETWGKQPGKLSYVYLQAGNGQLIGYYIFKGLPVS